MNVTIIGLDKASLNYNSYSNGIKMLENTQSHAIDNFDDENMQEMLENILHDNLEYKTRAVRLGRRIIKINYYDPKVNYNLQRDNKIIILQDPKNTCHVNFQGQLNPAQISNVWTELKKTLSKTPLINEEENVILTREELIYEIIEKLESKHVKTDTFKILNSIKKFQEKYIRLPFKNEIDQIIDLFMDVKEEKIRIKVEEPKIQKKKENIQKIKSLPGQKTTNKKSGKILIIQKPDGRRSCPHCGNISTYKIYEQIDKSFVLCAFPRLYGKRYYCDGCRGIWREQ